MKKVNNKFFDLILFFLSFLFAIYRSLLSLFKKKSAIKKSGFYDSIDYIFRIWPNNFWKDIKFYKIWYFLWWLIKYIFYKKK